MTATTQTQAVATLPAPQDMGSARVPDDHVMVLFGATGDLARRKLLPGLFDLSIAGLLPEQFRIIGSATREISDDEFRARTREGVARFASCHPDHYMEEWERFARTLALRPAHRRRRTPSSRP